jgi:hypothetical protein
MVKFLLAILLVVGVAAPASAINGANQFTPKSGGESPFPWGSESPFPWKMVDGLWKSKSAPLYFKFEAIRTSAASSLYLRVRLLDRSGILIAEGVGVTRDFDQIIRARVIGKRLDAYALVRAYNRRKVGDQCGSNDCVMVVTLREKDAAQGKDLHYLLEKVPLRR